jgi:hypothetical protein
MRTAHIAVVAAAALSLSAVGGFAVAAGTTPRAVHACANSKGELKLLSKNGHCAKGYSKVQRYERLRRPGWSSNSARRRRHCGHVSSDPARPRSVDRDPQWGEHDRVHNKLRIVQPDIRYRHSLREFRQCTTRHHLVGHRRHRDVRYRCLPLSRRVGLQRDGAGNPHQLRTATGSQIEDRAAVYLGRCRLMRGTEHLPGSVGTAVSVDDPPSRLEFLDRPSRVAADSG